MKQVHLELLLCLLLAISATGQYHSVNTLGHRLDGQRFGAGQPDLSGYGFSPDSTSFENYGQQSNSRLSSLSRTNNGRHVNKEVSPLISNFQGIQRDQTFDNNNKYVRPYAEPTGPPFGIQATGYVLSYPAEKLDLSKCGPQPTINPCVISGPQYHALPGYPNCYIHCSFGRIFIKPCPNDLVWNTRISSCDWPTIGSIVETGDNPTIPYDPRLDDYENGYGRKKRSTTERKKRNLGGYEAYYRNLRASSSQNPHAGYYPAPSYQPGPLRIPLTSYNLPGPVGFSGQVGFVGMPSQYAGSQSFPQAMVQSAAPTLPASYSLVPAPPPPVPLGPTPATSDPNAQVGSNSQSSGLYADSYGISARNTQAAPPTAQVTAYQAPATALPPQAPAIVQTVPMTAFSLQPPLTFFPGLFPAEYFPQQRAAPVNPFVARTPAQLELTLIPGPFYPYGPPHGGPFGGPMPPAPPTPRKLTFLDYLKLLLSSRGHNPSPYGFSQPHTASPSMFSDGNLFSMLKSSGGQSAPTHGGQYPSTDSLFGGQTFHGFMPVNDEQYPPATSYGGGKKLTNEQNRAILEFDFPPFDDDEDEDEDEGEKGKGKDNAVPGKADVKPKTRRSNSEDDNRNGQSRKKRQFDAFATTVGQVPAVGGTERQQYPASFNPFQTGSHGAVQQSRFSSNQYSNPSLSQLSPCIGKSAGSNTAHPTDDTKYIACLNKFYYEAMNCPLGLIYNAATDRCEKRKNPASICDREQPCMNGGQCYQTGPIAYKCACNGAWTGERCETQLSSCATNPCGPGNICQTIKTSDYKQDYVCVCDENQSYGPNCGLNTVPNPCLTTAFMSEQYHQFAFSAQAFIQCNGDLLYVQPCAPGLIWDKDAKVCDRPEIISDVGLHDTTERKLISNRFGPIFGDQTIVKPQVNQQKDILIQQKQQERPALKDQSSTTTPVSKTETLDTYVKRPMYDDVYYEPPRIQMTHRQPFIRFRPELPKNINMQ